MPAACALLKVQWNPCGTHCLHTVVTAGLKSDALESLIKKIKKIVRYFRCVD
jgi:hypothetical protein